MEGRTLADRYLLGESIGRGGMGIVHRATDRSLERTVAVKLLPPEADVVTPHADVGPHARDRLLVEAKRTAGLRHPNIVEVFDVGEDEGDLFVVMELLDGETLQERLARGRLDPKAAVDIGIAICDALAAAHDGGFVHRDLKPANVFLANEGPKLLDFGVAKRIDGATVRTDPGMLVGTIVYMSPEQIRGGAIDGRSDLYALGLVLYRAIAGALPFAGDNAATVIHQTLNVPPEPLRTKAEVSVALDRVVLRLLAKSPDDRYANAREARAALLDARDAPIEGAVRSEHVVELAIPDDAPSLELDRPLAKPRATAPIASIPPPLEPAPLAPRPELPAWLEPFAAVPIAISKRVVGYSLVSLLLYHLFFRTTLVGSFLLFAVAVLGGIAVWARQRLEAG